MNIFGKKTRYESFLEEENKRLRAENRQLLNSILQVAGHAPIHEKAEEVSPAKPKRRMTWYQLAMHKANQAVKQAEEEQSGARTQS